MKDPLTLALLALAGGLGTLARFGLASLVQRAAGSGFPAGTFAVNVLGCLLFGFLWSFFESRLDPIGEWRLVVLTGFLGGFTTFSSYIFETGALWRAGDWPLAALNLLGQNAAGLAALFLGQALGPRR